MIPRSCQPCGHKGSQLPSPSQPTSLCCRAAASCDLSTPRVPPAFAYENPQPATRPPPLTRHRRIPRSTPLSAPPPPHSSRAPPPAMALPTRAAAAVACLLLALAASASAAGKGSHSPAPAPATDCIAKASSLMDCLSYVSPGSTDKSPSKTCCGEVKTAVADPATVDCLCKLAGSKNLGFPIDMKRVFALPPACGLSNTVFSKCNISVGSPTEAPGASTGGSPSGGATASPPKAAASSTMTATTLVAAVAAPLLAYCYLS